MAVKKELNLIDALLSSVEQKPTKKFRLKRDDGTLDATFTLQAISGKEITKMREQATFVTKKGVKEVDEELFGCLLIQRGCQDPDWNDGKLVAKFGTPENAIMTILLAGEISRISSAILKLSGFVDDEEDSEYEELKN